MSITKLTYVGIVLTLSVLKVTCQTLIANGNFEDINVCTEYNAKCAPEAWYRIPPGDVNVNSRKIDRVFEGANSEIIVIENNKHPKTYRVYLYTMLLNPLIAGESYEISFYLNPIYKEDYRLGLLFTQTELIAQLDDPVAYSASLQITSEDEISFDKKTNWRKVVKQYKAEGDEHYLTIGNFDDRIYQFSKKHPPNNRLGDRIYLIDNFHINMLDTMTYANDSLMMSNRAKLYNHNYRHTDKLGIHTRTTQPLASEKEQEKELLPKKIRKLEKELKLEIPDIAFDFNSDKLKDVYLPKVDSLIREIENYEVNEIHIIGHTDDIGDEKYNQTLSEKRALAVYKYMLQISERRYKVYTTGYGETQPRVPNDSAKNRSLNRRVEIIIK